MPGKSDKEYDTAPVLCDWGVGGSPTARTATRVYPRTRASVSRRVLISCFTRHAGLAMTLGDSDSTLSWKIPCTVQLAAAILCLA
jgi:hypothetical protein